MPEGTCLQQCPAGRFWRTAWACKLELCCLQFYSFAREAAEQNKLSKQLAGDATRLFGDCPALGRVTVTSAPPAWALSGLHDCLLLLSTMSPRPFKHFSPKEKELLRGWLAAGKTRAEAARLLGRDLSTVVRQAKLLKRRGPPPTKGRPKKIGPKLAAALAKKAQLMTKAADANCFSSESFDLTLAVGVT